MYCLGEMYDIGDKVGRYPAILRQKWAFSPHEISALFAKKNRNLPGPLGLSRRYQS